MPLLSWKESRRTSSGEFDLPKSETGYARTLHNLAHTDEEAQDLLGMPPNTQRPRRIELVNAGFVADSGSTRLTKSGRKAVVWIVRKKPVSEIGNST